MEIYRIRLGSATLASIAGLCLVALAACGGGSGGGGSPTTMQITPSKPNSLSIAQVNELPSEQSFDATLTSDEEDQTLVYGFALETGDLFGVEVTVESGQGQAMVRFYGQNGENITAFDLPGGGVGFEAPSAGNYFMAISAAPSGEGGRTRRDAAPRAVFAAPWLLGISWGTVKAAAAGIGAAALPHLKAAVVSAGTAVAVQKMRDLERGDLEVSSPTITCLSGKCTIAVRVANVGGRVEGITQGALTFRPNLTFYRSTDNKISDEDMSVGSVSVVQIANILSSTASVPVPLSIVIDEPMVPGTSFYGACVTPIFLESGTGLPVGPLSEDLTGNNCSKGVELMVAPTVSIADADFVVEGNPLVFTVSLNGSIRQTVTVDWELSSDSETRAEDFTGATNGTLIFNPGDTSKTIALSTLADQENDGLETAIVVLSDPQNAKLGEATANGIVGDEVTRLTYTTSWGSSNAFTLTLAEASNRKITIRYTVNTGSSSRDHTLIFNPGETRKTMRFGHLGGCTFSKVIFHKAPGVEIVHSSGGFIVVRTTIGRFPPGRC